MQGILEEMMIFYDEICRGNPPILGGAIIEIKDNTTILRTSSTTNAIKLVNLLSISENGKVCPMDASKTTIVTTVSHTDPSKRRAYIHVENFTLKICAESPYDYNETLYFFGWGENVCFKCIFFNPKSMKGSIGCSIEIGFRGINFYVVNNSILADLAIITSGKTDDITEYLALPVVQPVSIEDANHFVKALIAYIFLTYLFLKSEFR